MVVKLPLEDSSKRVDRAVVNAVVRNFQLNDNHVRRGIEYSNGEGATANPPLRSLDGARQVKRRTRLSRKSKGSDFHGSRTGSLARILNSMSEGPKAPPETATPNRIAAKPMARSSQSRSVRKLMACLLSR